MSRALFPLFQTPIDLAQGFWNALLCPKDCVIDATCGNGHDTLVLARLVPQGHVFALDKQMEAIEATKRRLCEYLPPERRQNVSFYHQCHSTFPKEARDTSIALVVYNLGYLPGNDKQITTMKSTTLQSLQEAMLLVRAGGVISMTCYPGHAEGKNEEEVVLEYLKDLNPQEWSCCHHRWLNRQASPSLVILQKRVCE